MAISQKSKDLLERLLSRTVGGALTWSEATNDDSYQTAFPAGSVLVFQDIHDFTGASEPVVVVRNSEGKLVERIEGGNLNDRSLLESLHVAARRSARDADGVVNSILDDLE